MEIAPVPFPTSHRNVLANAGFGVYTSGVHAGSSFTRANHGASGGFYPSVYSLFAEEEMKLALKQFVDDFAAALSEVDHRGDTFRNFRPGIGPFAESNAVRESLAVLKEKHPEVYAPAVTMRQPDLLIPDEWQVEFKIVRPFGDNGREAENWSQNVLHPYPGNTSSIGDCLKLIEAEGNERKAVVVFGYEHDSARIPLDPCIEGFELLAGKLFGIRLSRRIEKRVGGLIHPVHQVLRVFAWEVLGKQNEGE